MRKVIDVEFGSDTNMAVFLYDVEQLFPGGLPDDVVEIRRVDRRVRIARPDWVGTERLAQLVDAARDLGADVEEVEE